VPIIDSLEPEGGDEEANSASELGTDFCQSPLDTGKYLKSA
jgi:hypothetical protein